MSPDELVNEIAKLLENDNICYLERANRQIISIEEDELNTPEGAEQLAMIEDNIEKYLKFPPIPTQRLLIIMQDFLAEVTDKEIERELSKSLKRKNPTRNFLQIVESRIDINQHWKLFKREQSEEYVAKIFIKDYNY